MTDVIRVLLADDHHVVRAGLRAVLGAEPDIVVVAEVSGGQDAIDRARAGDVDVVLMDLQFGPGPQGLDATAAIAAMPGAPRVLVLTTYDSDADLLAALEAGATGYLLKDTPPEDLARAVRAAAAGEQTMAPALTSRLVRRVRQPQTALSPREIEVLQLVASGLSNRDIAKRLFLSEATVKSHLVHVFGKLGADSRTAAVASARERGIIRP